ncbi:hypothetical protein HPB52_010463 [Rhipicephalus sanguineus]|uniref:Uncharacterized protein n=1 Tax=Rhipicephalus sanguineus TaxID=34632 RepID=A0A9D4Q5G1_RHISA|nr:hypothetical protein HPB52_010463 [Rhipicephalus sanguineus]
MADHYGCVAYFTDYAGRVEEITQDEAYRYAPPLRQVLRDRHNPIKVYNDAEFLSQSLFQAGGATPVTNAAAGHKGQRTRSIGSATAC